MSAGAAVFDFDRTMIRQESMALFLQVLAGRGAYVSACCVGASRAALAEPRRRMQVFREELLRRTLAGRTMDQVQVAAEHVFARLRWIDATMDDFARHRDAGRRILVATGSLSCYVPAFLALRAIEVESLFTTEVVVDGDVMTGELATPSCTWAEKARRVEKWLSTAADGGNTWGYGNMPHDGAMLALVDHPTVVPV